MNNSGAIYVKHDDAATVAGALGTALEARGFHAADVLPGQGGQRIMAPDKRVRLFFVAPPQNGWVTVWEDPRYFGDRALAQALSGMLDVQTIWVEVSGNAVGWCYGVYEGGQALDEVYEPLDTTFYGEYGTIYFAFNVDTLPEEFIAQHGLPYDELHYEAVLEGALPPEAGVPLHLSFAR